MTIENDKNTLEKDIDRLNDLIREIMIQATEYEDVLELEEYYKSLKLINQDIENTDYRELLNKKNRLERKAAEIRRDLLLNKKPLGANNIITEPIKKRYKYHLKEFLKRILKRIKNVFS